ncbi:vWA domain-containing protein [Sutcliffiella halmapala]
MGFTAPLYFFLTAFLLFVIFLYFFRKQYEKKSIPSVLLWQEWMNEFEAQAWWKKLQHHILLYLQLLALLFLIFSLVRPYFEKEGIEGDHFVFIFDTSASMTALADEESTRFELAKQEALDTLEELGDQAVTIIVANDTPLMIEERVSSKREIRRHLEALTPSYSTANLTDSIELAKSLMGEEQGQIHVFSDNLSKSTDISFHKNTRFAAHNFGEEHPNLSLVTFGVSMNDEKVIGVATIKNESKVQKEVILNVYGEDENLVEVTERLEPNETKTIYLENLSQAKIYRAEISGDTHYVLDNEQYAFLLDQNRSTIFVHEAVHPFARKALEIASSQVIHLTSNSIVPKDKEGVHFIKGLPMDEWPDGPKFIFLPMGTSPEVKVELEGEVSFDQNHPLLNMVEIDKVFVQSAYSSKIEGLSVLAQKGNIPLLLEGMYDEYPIIVQTFELDASDWPLHPSFPLFLYNAIEHLTAGQELMGYYSPGDWLEYIPASDTSSVEIVNDKGEAVIQYKDFDQNLQLPIQPGLYTFKEVKNSTTKEKLLTVMLDDEEKTIVPEESFSLSSSKAVKVDEGTSSKDVTYIFLILGLLVLLVEWEVYRRAVAN